jgi:hypothetical protein
MPISIRSPAPHVFAASYHFPSEDENSEVNRWPWLQPSDPNAAGLCDTCSRLNFSWLLSKSLYEVEVSDDSGTSRLSDGICLGSYAIISSRTSCQFCQLLVHALENGADIEMLNEYDAWPDRELYIMNYLFSKSGLALSPDSKKGEYAVRLGVLLKAVDYDAIMNFGSRTVMIQQIHDSVNQPPLYVGRPLALEPAGLVETIRQWGDPCLSIQTDTPLLSRRIDRTPIRLIDVDNSCITAPLPTGERHNYIALSYTWGKIDPLVLKKDNEAELQKEGALKAYQSQLPLTIKDAINLCRMLGWTYLWVDSLCICQDTVDKHNQIQQMDRIYEEAFLTIIAAAGKDANAGLPGVSNPRDVHQRIISIGNISIANLIPSLGASIASSFWESRGWTFQESLLSHKKLIFTPDQTYYHCEHGECSEDTHDNIHKIMEIAASAIPLRLNIENQSNWKIYRNVVAEYCKRYLSYESDILNAFAGIAGYMSEAVFAGAPLIMGIPSCSLEVGLLWHPAEKLRRRAGDQFPSWSWAGWIGMVEYSEMVDYDNIFDRTISRIVWDSQRTNNQVEGGNKVMTCMPPPSWDGWRRWERMVTREMDETYFIRKDLWTTRWFAHPIASQQQPVQLQGSRLRLTADVARLKLTGEHAKLWYESEDCNEGNHEVCRLQVFSQSDHRAGIVVMDGTTFASTTFSPDSLFCFIKVSQTTLAPGRDDPAWDIETKTYAGIPGEPAINPRPPFDEEEEEFDQEVYDRNICWCLYNVLVVQFEGDVARRIAVGQLHITAFEDALPERRTFWFG